MFSCSPTPQPDEAMRLVRLETRIQIPEALTFTTSATIMGNNTGTLRITSDPTTVLNHSSETQLAEITVAIDRMTTAATLTTNITLTPSNPPGRHRRPYNGTQGRSGSQNRETRGRWAGMDNETRSEVQREDEGQERTGNIEVNVEYPSWRYRTRGTSVCPQCGARW